MAKQNKYTRFDFYEPGNGEMVFALTGVIDMEQVVRRIHHADRQAVLNLGEYIRDMTVQHLYRTWKEQSGAAGRSVQVRGDAKSSSGQLRPQMTSVGAVPVGGFSVQVGSFYDAGNFQRGINHFVLLEGGFTLRNGRFKAGGHSLAIASHFFAGALPKEWMRHYNSGVR